MNPKDIQTLLENVKNGSMSTEAAMAELKDLPYKDLSFAKIDNHRELRIGYPEVVYCAGKTTEQVVKIFEYMLTKNTNILATRAPAEVFEAVSRICPAAEYNPIARAITFKLKNLEITETYIAVVAAGTSDMPVAEEAAVTAEIFGNRVERIIDVGVAGIHRLFAQLDKIRGANVIIAVAGMEGALPGVLGGLVNIPIVAVPTSVGYGANFGGLSALLTMLNSCAPGIGVVNIDNGFGAGYLASQINKSSLRNG